MKKKQASGGKRLAAKGRKPVLLALTPEQHATLFAAAALDNRRATQFLIHYGLAAAGKILSKNGKDA